MSDIPYFREIFKQRLQLSERDEKRRSIWIAGMSPRRRAGNPSQRRTDRLTEDQEDTMSGEIPFYAAAT